ncbi:protein kinase domain-containing protein [Micromonospora lupini]|uniref:non-specific serine/threonine protein kinase n=1 Tax=Micromonospora lupini str. Lupac 08 TaxID=1150864 RepID=I0L0Z6_9ACTN|nr:serine/threonine-protein kinase [Micromonospora lupini]CCH17493.1 Serine/threonine-protein kinase-like domain [Micromonospora lupini str. Lupac 08]
MTAPQRIGPYAIERLLGVGSFATVWLGYDPVLDARVAIKVLAENWSHDLRVRERFLDEARLLRRLEHERLIRVHTVGDLPDGRPYAVLAWADGGSLRDRLATGDLPAPTALRLLGEICAGVAVLHRHGVVHRDLTPGNVLFRSAGPDDPDAEQVLIADLGLAKALAAASGLTARAGTPGYMAPEQDDPGAVVDTRADVYGLGRLGIRLLAAGPPDTHPPRPGPSPDLRLRAHVPAAVAAVLARATAYHPADRYPDAAALRAALIRVSDPAGPLTPPTAPGARSPSPRPGVRRSYRLRLAGAVVVAAVAVAGVDAEPGGTRSGRTVDGTYTTGPLTVALPPGWSATGATWAGQYDADGEPEPALVMSPQPRRWAADPHLPGAFVGLSATTAARTTPAGFLAERTHGDCAPAPARTTRQAGIEWTVVTYRCDRDRPSIVESAGLHPARRALVYVQIAPPADSRPDFVDTLLAGVRVTGPPR